MDSRRVVSFNAFTAAQALDARTQYEFLMDELVDIESSMDDSEELNLMLAAFGQSVVLQVTSIDYHDKLMVFSGFVDGKEATLFQHVGQLNFLVLVRPKRDPSKPPCRISARDD